LQSRRHRMQRYLKPGKKRLAPARLPWQVLSGITRVLQCCWGTVGIFAFFRESGLLVIDDYRQVQHTLFAPNCSGERRLEEVAAIAGIGALKEIDLTWPYGGYFRPETISCGHELHGGLMIGSAFALYTVHQQQQHQRWHLQEIAAGIEGGVPLCPSPLADSALQECFWGSLSEHGLKLVSFSPTSTFVDGNWTQQQSMVLPIQGPEWKSFNGAIVPCSSVNSRGQSQVIGPVDMMLPSREGADWCLALAGWDGQNLPLAFIALDGLGQLPSEGSVVRPYLDAPHHHPARVADMQLQSLQLQASDVRLWALFLTGSNAGSAEWHLQAWDLLSLRTVGRWRPSLPWKDGAFQPTAVCEDAYRRLFLVGFGHYAVGLPDAPLLLHAPLLSEAQPSDVQEKQTSDLPRR